MFSRCGKSYRRAEESLGAAELRQASDAGDEVDARGNLRRNAVAVARANKLRSTSSSDVSEEGKTTFSRYLPLVLVDLEICIEQLAQLCDGAVGKNEVATHMHVVNSNICSGTLSALDLERIRSPIP